MRVFVVTRNGVLGLEPVAVFSDWEDADEFCQMSDDDCDDPTKSIFDIRSFTTNQLLGLSLSDADELGGDCNYYDDEDEDYDD